MKTAGTLGLLGLCLTMLLGVFSLQWSPLTAFLCFLSSNLAGLASILITLQVEHLISVRQERNGGKGQPWGSTFKSWTLLFLLYFSMLLLLSPSLRNVQAMLYLCFPLILSTGFCIILFGPIRDSIVRKRQKKGGIKEANKADFTCFPPDSAML